MTADILATRTWCLFVECPASGGQNRCPDKPAYQLWIEDCRPCREGGQRMGIADMDCVGHWTCVRHGAEVRIGKLVTTGGADLKVKRIQSLRLDIRNGQERDRDR